MPCLCMTGGHLRLAPCLGPMALIWWSSCATFSPHSPNGPMGFSVLDSLLPGALSLRQDSSSFLLALGPKSHWGLCSARLVVISG